MVLHTISMQSSTMFANRVLYAVCIATLYTNCTILCSEQKRDYTNLSEHILDWTLLLVTVPATYPVRRTETTVQWILTQKDKKDRAKYCQSTLKKSNVHIYLTKRSIHTGSIKFNDLKKSFSAPNCMLSKIGNDFFNAPRITNMLQHISLDNNNLTSYEEIHENILKKCHSLRTFSVAHNKLNGDLYLTHPNIESLNVSHNNFSHVTVLSIPQCTHLDLRNNPIDHADYKQLETYTIKMLKPIPIPHNSIPDTHAPHIAPLTQQPQDAPGNSMLTVSQSPADPTPSDSFSPDEEEQWREDVLDNTQGITDPYYNLLCAPDERYTTWGNDTNY